MIESSCHCGRVKLEVASAPEMVKDCNCSLCRRYGGLWAYYTLDQVRIAEGDGATDIYMWGDRMIEIHRCKNCGCVTHWSPVDKSYNRMGVNARLMAPEILAKAQVQKFDGAAM
jgi:hypothetical protein